MKSVTVLLLTCLLACGSTAEGKKKRSKKRRIERGALTAVDRVVLPHFRDLSSDPKFQMFFRRHRERLRKTMMEYLRSKSYLEIIPVKAVFHKNLAAAKSIARKNKANGFFVGVMNDRLIRISLYSTRSGRRLDKWTFTVPKQKKMPFYKKMMLRIARDIVRSFPYRGYVIDSNKDRVRINIGRKDAVVKGDVLRLFEFTGKRPNFSSSKSIVGRVKVVSVQGKTAIAKNLFKSKKVPKFAKVAFGRSILSRNPSLREKSRFGRKGWVGLGAKSFYLNSQANIANANILRREYQVTLTPFTIISGGYGPFSTELTIGKADNELQKVSFLSGDLSYEVFKVDWGSIGWVSSAGLGFRSISVSADDPDNSALVSSTSYWPLFDQRLIYYLSPKAQVFGQAQLHYPVISNDEANGGNAAGSSYGFVLRSGLRLELTDSLSIENSIGSRYVLFTYANEDALQEAEVSIDMRGYYFF